MNIKNQFEHYVNNDNLSDLFKSDLDAEYYCEPLTPIKSTGFTPLMKLVLMGHLYKNNIDKLLQIIKKHIEENPAELYKKNVKGYTALMLICANGNMCNSKKIVKLLLKYNCDINLQDYYGVTCLMDACSYFRLNSYIVKMLLTYDKQDCDINLQNNDGRTALMCACCSSNLDIVKMLLKYDKQNYNKKLYLRECQAIKQLLSNDQDLNRNIIKNINHYNFSTFLNINKNVTHLLNLGLNPSLINSHNEQLKKYTIKRNNINYLLDKYYPNNKLYNVFKYYDAFIEFLKINTIKKFVNQELFTIIIFHLFS